MPLLLFSAKGSNDVGGPEDASRLVMIGTVEGAMEPGLAGGPAPWPVFKLPLLIHRNAGELYGGDGMHCLPVQVVDVGEVGIQHLAGQAIGEGGVPLEPVAPTRPGDRCAHHEALPGGGAGGP